jgi:hypothetical protein
MTMAEIIRQLMDKLEQINPSSDVDPVEQEPEHVKQPMMIPPLQAKLELLKKAVGVKSVYDDEDEHEGCGCEDECTCGSEEGDSELDALKRNAGISPVAIQIASDDEPLE